MAAKKGTKTGYNWGGDEFKKAHNNPGKTVKLKSGEKARVGTLPSGRDYVASTRMTAKGKESVVGVAAKKGKGGLDGDTTFYKDRGPQIKGGVRKVVSSPEGKYGFQRNRRIKTMKGK